MVTLEATSQPRRWLQQSGFSIAEALVATAVMVTVLFTMYMIHDTAQQNHARGLAKAAVQQDVRVAFERLAQELRGAGYTPAKTGCTSPPTQVGSPPSNGISPIGSSPVNVQFLTDVDGDSCTDLVTYKFVPPTNVSKPCDDSDPTTIGKITRSVQAWNGTGWNPAIPVDVNQVQCITGVTICYWDPSGTTCTTAPANPVWLNLSVTGVENSRMTGAQTYTLTTDVRPRNL